MKIPGLLPSSWHPPRTWSLAGHKGIAHPAPQLCSQGQGSAPQFPCSSPCSQHCCCCAHVKPSCRQTAPGPEAAPAPCKTTLKPFRSRLRWGWHCQGGLGEGSSPLPCWGWGWGWGWAQLFPGQLLEEPLQGILHLCPGSSTIAQGAGGEKCTEVRAKDGLGQVVKDGPLRPAATA